MENEITHKVLINLETGKIIPPVYLITDERPSPPDAEWHEIQKDSIPYKLFVSNEDLTHLNLDEVYWDFESQQWIETLASSITIEQIRENRNRLLLWSDTKIAQAIDQNEIDKWKTYRNSLRTLFSNKPADFDWSTIIFPRQPRDIDALYELAALGNAEAIEIIKKDKL